MAAIQVFQQAGFAVQVHVVAAMVAVGLIPFVLWRQQRDRRHKILGYVWVSAMAITALSSFGISNFGWIGPFSPLHGLAVFTLWTLVTTVRAAIRRDIVSHRAGLRSLATFGLGIPMVLNFLPGRSFSRAFFAQAPLVGLATAAIVVGAVLLWRWSLQRAQEGRLA
ncbi:DUF2306 domain-containing protein [Phaeobacter sp. HF9A]|uniref:DUF2306 domain-containing protein n=1 Tax=Phaeobacter sp. HF9A TaxID=2721561 RepID=UPI001431B858|nr:DUF2306 domain-containing protein [Phaeobacter sp. HF9A]NIZ14760.1 DUF2306 domain-containing protein [Phaeobacter sp. HF9A]